MNPYGRSIQYGVGTDDDFGNFLADGFGWCESCDPDEAARPDSELTRYGSHIYCEDHYPKCSCGERVWEPGEGGCIKCELDAAIDVLNDDPTDSYAKHVVRLIAKETR